MKFWVVAQKRYIGKRVHGHTDTDSRTRTHGHLWKRRTVMEKTGSYGKDGQLWKRRALMGKTDTYGKDGHKGFETNFLSFKKEAHTAL